MIYQLHRTQQLHCDIDTAWGFFSSPHNLIHITPKNMKFIVATDLINESIYEGMIIDYKVSPLFGICIKWRTIITHVDEKKSFTDYQQKGPFKLWNHFHEFVSNEQGVLIKDTVNYKLPLGFIGDITHSLIVRKKLNYIFNYRYQVLEKMFNTPKI